MRVRLLAVAVLVAMAAACQTPPTPEPREIVIASDLPLNGPDSQGISQAIQLAIAQHRHVGPFQLAFQLLNDGPESLLAPVRGVQNVRRMIADSRVLGAVGPFTSAGAVEMIPVANAASFAMVSEAVTNWCVTLPNPLCNPQPSALRAAGPNNFFRIAAPDPLQGRAIARYMAHTLNVRRAAAFTLSDTFDDVTLGQFAEEFKRDGGDLVYSKNLSLGTSSFAPFLKAARAQGADAIFAATEHDVCLARAQMKGIFPQSSYFIGMDALQELDTCIPHAGDNAEGMLATVSVMDMDSSRDAAVMKVAADYRRAYPKSSPIDPYAYAGYECTMILIDAITQAVDADHGDFPTRPQVVGVLAHSPFKEAGSTFSFDQNGDALSPLMALYKVQSGKWVYVSQIDASAHSS